MTNEVNSSVQTAFIEQAINDRATVVIYLANGVKLSSCHVLEQDDTVLTILTRGNSGGRQLIYKQNISTIAPEM